MSNAALQFVQLIDEVARLRGRTTAAFREVRANHALSDIENVVLTAVAGAQRPPTVPQIGRSLGHPRQVIQRGADALVARGLIDWQDNPDHKRARLLVPTDAGRRIKVDGDAHGMRVAADLTEGVDPALIERTVRDLHRIREAIEANLRRSGASQKEDE